MGRAVAVDGISTIRYLTTVCFGFGASALLADLLAEVSIVRPFVVTDPASGLPASRMPWSVRHVSRAG